MREPRGALIEHHQLLALLEAPERRGQRADIHRLGGDIEQMVEQPADLGIEHADILAALRHFEAQQLFDRQAEGMLLVHRRDIIEPVEIGDRLQIGLVLDQLLGAAMQQADMRIDARDDLAVQVQHQAQHAMGGRMLRPEIDGELRSSVGRRVRPACFEGDGASRLLPRVAGGGVGRHRGLLIAGQDVRRAFPGAHEIEVAEFLHQLHRLIDDALEFVVIAHST